MILGGWSTLFSSLHTLPGYRCNSCIILLHTIPYDQYVDGKIDGESETFKYLKLLYIIMVIENERYTS